MSDTRMTGEALMTVKEFCENDGDICPVCNSRDVHLLDDEPISIEGSDLAIRQASCLHCWAGWTEEYRPLTPDADIENRSDYELVGYRLTHLPVPEIKFDPLQAGANV